MVNNVEYVKFLSTCTFVFSFLGGFVQTDAVATWPGSVHSGCDSPRVSLSSLHWTQVGVQLKDTARCITHTHECTKWMVMEQNQHRWRDAFIIGPVWWIIIYMYIKIISFCFQTINSACGWVDKPVHTSANPIAGMKEEGRCLVPAGRKYSM